MSLQDLFFDSPFLNWRPWVCLAARLAAYSFVGRNVLGWRYSIGHWWQPFREPMVEAGGVAAAAAYGAQLTEET